jgi:hypothetical protein
MENTKPLIIQFEGNCEIRRPDGAAPLDGIIIPVAIINQLTYVTPTSYAPMLHAMVDYAMKGTFVLSRNDGSCLPLLASICEASEALAAKRAASAESARRSANARWHREDDTLDVIDVPEIAIPEEINLRPFACGGYTISVQEYLKVRALFCLRRYREGEEHVFFSYWGRSRWNDGAIDGPDARWNRAQRWKQLDGEGRFADDDAAIDLFQTLLQALPSTLRAYVLAEGVEIHANGSEAEIHVPAQVARFLRESEVARAAMKTYSDAHGLPDSDGFVITEIPFIIKAYER